MSKPHGQAAQIGLRSSSGKKRTKRERAEIYLEWQQAKETGISFAEMKRVLVGCMRTL